MPGILQTLPLVVLKGSPYNNSTEMSGCADAFTPSTQEAEAGRHQSSSTAKASRRNHVSKQTNGVGETTQWFRGLATFSENPGSIPSTQMAAYNCL